MIKFDAGRLGQLIEAEYGVKFNVAYTIMEDQHMIEECVGPEEADASLLAEFQKSDYHQINNKLAMQGEPPLFETILCDLCFRGKLAEGDYLIRS